MNSLTSSAMATRGRVAGGERLMADVAIDEPDPTTGLGKASQRPMLRRAVLRSLPLPVRLDRRTAELARRAARTILRPALRPDARMATAEPTCDVVPRSGRRQIAGVVPITESAEGPRRASLREPVAPTVSLALVGPPFFDGGVATDHLSSLWRWPRSPEAMLRFDHDHLVPVDARRGWDPFANHTSENRHARPLRQRRVALAELGAGHLWHVQHGTPLYSGEQP